MMELICDYNKVVGYKVTNEHLSHKTWAPLNWLLLYRPLGIGLLMLRTDLCSLEIQRQLISAYISLCEGCLYLREGVRSTEASQVMKFCTDINFEIERHSGRIVFIKELSKFIVESWMNKSQSKNSQETEVLPPRPCGFVHEPCEFSKLILTFTETLFSFYAEPSD